jgi:hypothetical protein
MMQRRTVVVAIATAVLVLWSSVTSVVGNPWLVGVTPVLLAVWVLVMIYHGYFLLRASRWTTRQREERDALRELAIPGNVSRPEAFEGVQEIDDVQKHMLPRAPDNQGRYRAGGMVVALLPPLALLFLVVQTLFFPSRSPWGAGLVFGEALLLTVLVVLVWTSPTPTRSWVRARLRAELLRREQYLRLAAVGPYLGLAADRAGGASAARLDVMVSGDLQQLRQLLPLAAVDSGVPPQGSRFWIDDLWSRGFSSPALDSVADRMRSYLHYRIGKQLMWLTLGVDLNERSRKWITLPLKIAVVLALVAAVVHAVLQSVEAGDRGPEVGGAAAVSLVTILLASVLPPFSAALLAIQALFAFPTLAFSYGETRTELRRQKASLACLIDSYVASGEDDERRRLQTEFQALVLHTESALTHELDRWIMLIHRGEFEVSA